MDIDIVKNIKRIGINNCSCVEVSKIKFYKEFRIHCEMNTCGFYGNSWMCPPVIGNIEDLIYECKQYKFAIVYNTVNKIEDSFDIEGMLSAGEKHNKKTDRINLLLNKKKIYDRLHLGSGGCKRCSTCSILENKKCKFPDYAISSLSAYGISVSDLATLAKMKYINGKNSVTYFGAIFLKKD